MGAGFDIDIHTQGNRCDGSTTLTPCTAANNEYQDDTAQSTCKTCKDCPAGQIRTNCGGTSEGECTWCGAGDIRETLYTCTTCLAGTHEKDHVSCESCQEGRYSDQDGAERCTSCNHGKYQASTGQTGCTNCTGFTSHDGPNMAQHAAQTPARRKGAQIIHT